MQPGGAVSGQAFTTQPVIELRDAQNQPVLQSGVVVTATKASGSGVLGGTQTATTNAQGRATFTNLMITGTGAHTLDFTASGLTKATSQSFNVATAPATQLAVVTQPGGAVSGVAFTTQPVIELRDAQNQPVLQSGVVVTATKASGSGVLGGTQTATTNAQGRATFTNLMITGTGAHTLDFTASGLTKATSQSVNVAAAPATQLAVLTQPGGAVSGQAFTTQPVIELRDAQNQPVLQSGVVVTATKASGSGVLGGTQTATTNAQGRATFTNLMITGTGAHTLDFTASGLTKATSQSVNVAAPPATQLAVVTQPGGAVSGVAFTTQPVIELRDAQNQPVLQSGVVVTATKGSGSGSLSGTTTATTNAQGRATFTNLTITGAGAHTLSFTAAGLAGATSQSFNVATAPATQLAVVTQPGGAVSGQAFTTQPVIELRDAQNQPVLQTGVVVTATKASGSGVLSGTLTATTNAQGRATFTNLTITGAGAHTLSFTAAGLAGATSQSFNVATAPATQLAVVTQPGGAVSGVAFTTQPVVGLRDAQNQPVLQSGVVVTATKGSGSGSLSGTTTATTNAQGRATFTNLAITGTGAHTLSFTASGLTGTTSQSFNVNPPPQYLLTVNGAGAGSGTVTSSPAGITCVINAGVPTGDCTEPYVPGTVVTLTETPAVGSVFYGWITIGCGSATSCPITMNFDAAPMARFDLAPAPVIALSSTTVSRTAWDSSWYFDPAAHVFQPTTEDIQVTNAGTGLLTGLTVSLDSFEDCGGGLMPWVSGALSSGTAPTTLTISYPSPASLICAAYFGSLRAIFVIRSDVPGTAADTVVATIESKGSQMDPNAQTNPATSIGQTSATLNGQTGGDMHGVWYTFGTDSLNVADVFEYGQISVAAYPQPAFGANQWPTAVSGLLRATKYYFQVWALSMHEDGYWKKGGVRSFTTN